MSKKRLILTATLMTICAVAHTQKPQKWGNIPKEDLAMATYAGDSSARALILQDVGELAYSEEFDGFSLKYYQHRRIKVLDQNAFESGNLFIPYYSIGNVEKFEDLDVQVFAPDGAKTKVKTDNIFTEKYNKSLSIKKIFIPNLQKGSVIEYRFVIRTKDWFAMRPWFFQDTDFPTRWSELTLDVPQFFDYIMLFSGSRALAVNEQKDEPAYFRNDPTASYIRYFRRMAMKDLPALRAEPYLTTLDDYRAGVQFQMKAINIPGELSQPIMVSWEKLAQELEESENMGAQYRRDGKFNKIWSAFQASAGPLDALSAEQKLEKVRQFVAQNIQWDGSYRCYTDGSLDRAFEEKKGSSSEVNLAVIALLRKAKIDAWPLLISSRAHGVSHPEYPFFNQFNSLVAFLLDSNGTSGRIIDATSLYHPINLAQEEHYNGMGWILRTPEPQWVELTPPEYVKVVQADLELDAEGALKGHVNMSMAGHAAKEFRESVATDHKGLFLKKIFSDKFLNLTLDSLQLEHESDLSETLKAGFSIHIQGAAQVANDMIYCSPVVTFRFVENPFKTLERLYPVNFPYPLRTQYVLHLKIPAGYKLEELPDPANIVLPNNGGRLQFIHNQQPDGSLNLIIRLSIKQLNFLPEEYGALRQFFDQLIKKINEQIVVKKI